MSEINMLSSEKKAEKLPLSKRWAKDGPVFLRDSFRPLFLFAGIWAAVSVPLWLAAFTGLLEIPGTIDQLLWHQHEMLFGFIGAAISGFLLTAIPNWTGRLPVSGWRLGFLAACWLAGRAAMLLSATIGVGAVAILDMAFLVVFAMTIARELLSGKNWRNMPVLILMSLFALANGLVHLELTEWAGPVETAETGIRMGLFVILCLITLIGGRIIPSFTRNWLSQQGATSLPAPMGRFDQVALGSVIVVLIAQVFAPETQITAIVTVIAGVLHGIRLSRWKTMAVLSEPMLWAMHLGYAWIVAGLLLLGLAGLSPAIPTGGGYHALAAGGFATLIVAVMARATLGHSGRKVASSPAITAIFTLVTIAAALRVVASFSGGDSYLEMVVVAGIAWTAAFGLFTVLFWPLFTRPRGA